MNSIAAWTRTRAAAFKCCFLTFQNPLRIVRQLRMKTRGTMRNHNDGTAESVWLFAADVAAACGRRLLERMRLNDWKGADDDDGR